MVGTFEEYPVSPDVLNVFFLQILPYMRDEVKKLPSEGTTLRNK